MELICASGSLSCSTFRSPLMGTPLWLLCNHPLYHISSFLMFQCGHMFAYRKCFCYPLPRSTHSPLVLLSRSIHLDSVLHCLRKSGIVYHYRLSRSGGLPASLHLIPHV